MELRITEMNKKTVEDVQEFDDLGGSVLCRGKYRSGWLARGQGPWIKGPHRQPITNRGYGPLWPSVKGAMLSAITVSTRISPILIIRPILLEEQFSSIWKVEIINFRVNTLFGVEFDGRAESGVILRRKRVILMMSTEKISKPGWNGGIWRLRPFTSLFKNRLFFIKTCWSYR